MTAKDRLTFRRLKKNPKRARRNPVRKARKSKRRKVTRAARNPKQKYVIAADVGTDRTYYDGAKTFALSKDEAKRYSAEHAAKVMRAMLSKLPPSVRAIRRLPA